MDSGFQLLDSRSYTVELGFRIPIVRGIPDSDSCIPDSKAQDSGFHKQKSPRFRILHAKISRIPESGFPYMGRFVCIPVHISLAYVCIQPCNMAASERFIPHPLHSKQVSVFFFELLPFYTSCLWICIRATQLKRSSFIVDLR